MLENAGDDFHVVDVDAVNILHQHVESGTVHELDACDFGGLNSGVLKHQWSLVGVLMIPVSDPPVIAEAINCTLTPDIDHLAILEVQEVLPAFALCIHGPVLPVCGHFQGTVDLEGHVVEVRHVHGVRGDDEAFGEDNSPIISLISLLKACHD